MKRNLLQRWMVIAVLFLGFSAMESYAQKYEFAWFDRYAKDNAAMPAPKKGEKRVVFMGNSITEGWVNTHPEFFSENGYISDVVSEGRLLISFCFGSVKM